jgi:hypothetical protein
MADLLGTQRHFYRILDSYVADNSLAVTLAMDEAESALEYYNSVSSGKRKNPKSADSSAAENFETAVSKFIKEKNGAALARWIIDLPDEYCHGGSVVKTALSEAVLDDELCVHNCLCLLIVHWAAHELRIWVSKM